MLFKEANPIMDNILYPVKSSLIQDEEQRHAISLACEALKILENISERCKAIPEEIQNSLIEFKVLNSDAQPEKASDYAYNFVVDTMAEIENLIGDENSYDFPA